MKNKSVLIIALSVVLMVTLFFVATHLYKSEQVKKPGFQEREDYKLLAPDYAVRKGSVSAKVVVVEFFDPQCESCRTFYPQMDAIMQEYQGQIQLVLRYAAFHGDSIFAIKILEAARKQNRYWEVLEVLYEHQPEWGSHHNPQPDLVWNYLAQAGVDVQKLQADLNHPETQRIIEQDTKDGQKLNVRMTPSFFINGKALQNFGADFLRQAINEALQEEASPE